LIAGSHGRCQEGDKHNKFRCQHHGFNIDCHNTADNSQYSKRYGQLKPRSWLQPSNHKERVGMDMLVSMSTPIRVTQVWQNLTTSQSKSWIEAEKEKKEKSLRHVVVVVHTSSGFHPRPRWTFTTYQVP
jgi:hypothetical protein